MQPRLIAAWENVSEQQVGVRQRRLPIATLFNVFLERIMSAAMEEHDVKVSIGGRNIANLRFADYIDAVAEKKCKQLL